jgi:hypothetical protein
MIDKAYPTPWRSRGTLGPRRAQHLRGPCVIEDCYGNQIAILSGWSNEEQVKVARLLAAAPELLEALQEASVLSEKAKLAIKKATHGLVEDDI